MFLVLLLIFWGPALYANDAQSYVEAGWGRLSGNTVYQIGGTALVPGTISELEFPIDVSMLSCRGKLGVTDWLSLSASYSFSLTGNAGDMLDSDWGYWRLQGFSWASPTSLDIYSESEAELDARMLNIKARLNPVVYQKDGWQLRVGAGLGYLKQKFEYDISHVDQWYPSYPQYASDIQNEPLSEIPLEDRERLSGHDYASGLVVAYEVTYEIPYAELGGGIALNDNFFFGLNLGFSPFVSAEDYDNHILRSKISKGHCHGDAFMQEITATYIFKQRCRLGVAYEHLKIDTGGTQRQYFSDGDQLSIQQDITSSQRCLSLRLGVSF